MAKKSQKVKVQIKWYKTVTVEYRGVKVDLLDLVSSYESEEAGNPLDILLNIVERLARKADGDYFEVIVQDGSREIMGESPRYTGKRSLFLYPVKIKRLAVVKYKDLKPADNNSGGEADVFSIKEEDIKWRRFRKEYYVYEGKIEAGDEVYLIIIDTEAGRRIIRTPTKHIILTALRSSQPPPRQETESRKNGHG